MSKNSSLRKLIQKFHKLGFDAPYSGGRHLFTAKGELKVRVPNSRKGDISKHLLS